MADRCTCSTCWPEYPYFRVCQDCGNKRCPKAKHHGNACTNSNEPGQKGSNYEDVTTRSKQQATRAGQ